MGKLGAWAAWRLALVPLAWCVPAPLRAESAQWQWVQYVPGGVEARATTAQASCPTLVVDGVEVPMATRSSPGQDYPVRVCAAPIPAGARVATIGDAPLRLPRPHPNRILIVGDTGCRLKGQQIQACNDLSEWPFRLGATMSATFKPDLVLHVGDFHYRESACPFGNHYACGGSPFGDTWDVWQADFFSPGDSLLRAAPWIFVRGNHEECERGGKGWARTLDPYPFEVTTGAAGCLGPARPYTVDIGGLTIVVMDVSTADESVNPAQVAWFTPQFALARTIPGPVWLTFHRPVWAVDAPDARVRGDNGTLAAAARDTVPANVQAFVSGHHHTFEAMSYVEDLPLQIVSGHGGDDLAPRAPNSVVGLRIEGINVKAGIARPRIFGFSMIERAPDDDTGLRWTLTGYDTHGRPIGVCRLDGRAIDCD